MSVNDATSTSSKRKNNSIQTNCLDMLYSSNIIFMHTGGIFVFLFLLAGIQARCYDPSPAFPLPKLHTYNDSPILRDAFHNISASIQKLVSQREFDTSSFSIEITTSEKTLWTLHHTARERDAARPGVKEVDGDSVYRMASVTKAFTTLAIIKQHIAGNLSLDDPINRYLELEGDIPWKGITLRTTASQLSGIPREFAQADLINSVDDPIALGLPPVTRKGLPECGEYYRFEPCDEKDLLVDVATKQPLWPPKQKSTYSNLNFILLGLVVENATGKSYSEYVREAILSPLHMKMSSFVKPNDSVAVLPKGDNSWDIEEGVRRPTGGLYSSSSDMSKYLRYVLTHYNGLTPQLNWFQPASYSTSLSSFYGMPWEIFRTTFILPFTSRPTTFVTKSGALPGYFSSIIMAPDYDLGVTILTASLSSALKSQVLEMLTVPLTRAAEETAQSDLQDRYTGIFNAKDLNSSLVLEQADNKSLYIHSFISNSTDVLASFLPLLWQATAGSHFRIQLVPTLLYRDEEKKKGELWRGVVVPEKRGDGVWDEFCLTDEDPGSYAGKPLFEFVLWGAEDGKGRVREVEVSAFRVRLEREVEEVEEEGGRRYHGTHKPQKIVFGNE